MNTVHDGRAMTFIVIFDDELGASWPMSWDPDGGEYTVGRVE